jgi:uncharacterized protein YndB with AHSA1/START domain
VEKEMPADAQTQSKDFVLSRVFDAPRDLVWQAFTQPERMKQWWGPKGFTLIVSKMDLRVGGTYHYGMTAPNGSAMWGLFKYREIAPLERLVLINSFSDENGGLTRHPMNPNWPQQLLTTFTFEEQTDGKTKFTLRWSAYNATAVEQKTFDDGHASMTQGWGGTLEQLATYLKGAA